MRIVTRLVLALGIAVSLVMAVYGVIALRQREALLADALARETETLARALQITTDNALRDGRFEDLDRVLGGVTMDEETYVAAVIDRQGDVVVGGPPAAIACLAKHGSLAQVADVRGWSRCGRTVRWVALPTRDAGSTLLVARHATVLERDVAASRWRMLLTTLALAAVAAVTILVVLRRTLSIPLEQVMRGVRTLSAGAPAPVRLEVGPGEIGELASTFNEMAIRLDEQGASLRREAEDRLALERRLRRAEKFAAIGRLTGGLAHELGSPLNTISMRAEAVAMDESVPASARHHAGQITREVDRVADLVRKLTQVARRHPVKPQRVDLRDVIRDVAETISPRSRDAGIGLQLALPDDTVPVNGEPTLLRHAVQNLAFNAVESLERAGAERRMSIELSADREHARVEVVDNGPGIAPDDLPQIFDPFFTTREVGQGMGLGLAISLGIIEEHGGELSVQPDDVGVRATVSLPLADKADAVREPVSDGADGPGGSRS